MKKRIYSVVLSILLASAVFILPIVNSGTDGERNITDKIKRVTSIINKPSVDDSNTQNTSPKINIPKSDAAVTFIVVTEGDSLSDAVLKSNHKFENVYALLSSDSSRKYLDNIKKTQAVVKASIEKIITQASFQNSYTYNTVLNGFTVTAPYSAMEKIQKITGVVSVIPVFGKNFLISDIEDEDDYDYYYDDENDYDYYEEDDDYYYESETDEYEPDEYYEEDENEESSDEDNPDEESEVSDTSETSEESKDLTPVYEKMAETQKAHEDGFTGAEKVIAFIDNSFDITHPAFSSAPSSLKYTYNELKSLTDKSVFNINSNSSVIKSDKIIFAYDYADNDDDTFSESSDHGTLTAVAAAGCRETDDENSFRSIAYNSQVIFMKVCSSDSNYASDDSLLAALDDTAKLSPDILNISMGMNNESELLTKAFDVLSQNGTLICAAAGNNAENVYQSDENGLSADYTDYGTISYPSTLPYVISAAASNSTESRSNYIETADGEKIPYADFVSNGETPIPVFSESSSDTEYIFINTYGEYNDYKELDVKGKVVIVKRGAISFDDKLKYAAVYGAAGVIVISDEPLYIPLCANESMIPCAYVSGDAEKYFNDNPSGTLNFKADGTFDNPDGGKPAEFSSYGVTKDLRLKPDLSAAGTEIEIPDNNGFSKFTGTSASSAVISGSASVLSQYLDGKLEINDTEKNTAITALLMNTAVPSKYDDKLYYSPRRQGAGNLSIDKAMNASVYITDLNSTPSVDLGDSTDGKYSFSLVLHNFSDDNCKFKLKTMLQSDKLNSISGKIYNTLTPQDISSYCTVKFMADNKEVKEVTVKAQDNLQLDCEIEVKPELIYYYQQFAKNGMYIDGYVFFSPEKDDESELSVPLMGYCGSWADAKIFDESVYQTLKDPAIGANSLNACIVDNGLYNSLVLGKNYFTGKTDSNTVSVGRETIKNAYDLQTNVTSFILPNYYLLHDTADYTISISDSSGSILYENNIGQISDFVSIDYEPYIGLLNSFNTDTLSNLFSELSDGSYQYTVTASTIDSNGSSGSKQSVSYPFTVDNIAPDAPSGEIYTKNSRLYLKLTSEDDRSVQGFILYTANNSNNNSLSYSDRLQELINAGYISEDAYKLISTRFENNSAEFIYDITDLYRSLKGLESYAKSNDMNVPVPTSIFAKAVDYSFNLSSPVEFGTTAPGSVHYTITDQYNRPVEGVGIEINGLTLTSGKNGEISFNDIIPDIYGAYITSLPDDYKAESRAQIIDINNNSYDLKFNLKLTYTGTEIVEDEVSETSVPDETVNPAISQKEDTKNTEKKDMDDSTFALIFVSTTLLISTLSLIISRRKKFPTASVTLDP